MSRATCEVNATSSYLDEEKDRDGLQEHGFYSEEITSQSLIFVVLHEMLPTQSRLTVGHGRDAVALEDIANSLLPEMIAQLPNFTHDFAIPQSFS